ncbi:MAG: ROK family protein, partial [Mangrovicoccus sp.]
SMTKELLAGMNDDAQRRVVGIGLAMPSAIYQWDTEMGLPEGALSDWKDRDPAAEISEATNHPCLLINDANAACAAELEHPENQLTETGIYLYFATFIGGAVVIDGRLFTGFRDQAGAIGSMPVPGTNGAGIAPQLIERASLLPLLQNLEAAGIDRAFFSQLQEDAIPSAAIPLFETWCADAAPHLAHSIFASASLLDIDKVVLDGILPPAWLDQLSQAVQTALAKFNTKGVAEFDISTGHLGRSARVMGAALMPFDARFTPDPSHLVTRSKLQPKAAAPA